MSILKTTKYIVYYRTKYEEKWYILRTFPYEDKAKDYLLRARTLIKSDALTLRLVRNTVSEETIG